MKKTFLIIIPIIIFITSCQKTLNIDIEDKDKKIVLNGILYPDSIIKVNISRSLGVLEEDSSNFQFLNKATAKLYENDNYIETLVFDSIGFYHSTIIPDPTKKYKLEVESEGIEKAIGRINFIKPIEFTISDMEYFTEDTTATITMPSWDDENYEDFEPFDTTFTSVFLNCKFNINDPANEDNFYIIEAHSFNFNLVNSSTYYYDNGNEYVEEGIYMEESAFGDVYPYYYIEDNTTFLDNSKFWANGNEILLDNLFDGQTLQLNFSLNFNTFDLQPIYIKMYSVPKDYINYVKSEDKYWTAHENPFAQPVNVFSNIENGFGILTAFSLYQQIITLD